MKASTLQRLSFSGLALGLACLGLTGCNSVVTSATAKPGQVASLEVSQAEMQAIFDEVKAPYKYGIIIQPEENEYLDCPNVFRHKGKWYMLFVGTKNKVGYESHLAVSDDLLHWKRLGKVLPFATSGWDKCQADGSVALFDVRWEGSHELETYKGKYWMSYFGGDKTGYETDPLSIGMAWTKDPSKPVAWTRLPENPVMKPDDPDARDFEKETLYKSFIFRDKTRTLGSQFVMFYNAKQKGPWIERIGIAVSEDMVHWKRHGAGPVIDNLKGISGDPQIVRMGDLWVMHYFGAGWKKGAFDTFAASRDLIHWTKWNGANTIEPTEPWEKPFAHKPWFIKHNGVVYHFYCAVSKQGRTIAVATSKDLREPAK